MLKVFLVVCFLAAGVFSESVRETETWVRKEVEVDDIDLESSGDFGFPTEDPTMTDDEDDDGDDDYEESGSGDLEEYEDYIEGDQIEVDTTELSNHIPEEEPPRTSSTFTDLDLVDENEVYRSSSVLQNKAEHNIFHKTEVLAAVIAGGAVGLLFAVLLILLLVYRMKKKDEGSYDLGKKPIYKKAPTTEIYA